MPKPRVYVRTRSVSCTISNSHHNGAELPTSSAVPSTEGLLLVEIAPAILHLLPQFSIFVEEEFRYYSYVRLTQEVPCRRRTWCTLELVYWCTAPDSVSLSPPPTLKGKGHGRATCDAEVGAGSAWTLAIQSSEPKDSKLSEVCCAYILRQVCRCFVAKCRRSTSLWGGGVQ